MTATAPAPEHSAAALLDELLAALDDLPEHLRLLRPSPWADWIADVRAKHAVMRNQLNDEGAL